MIDILKIFIKLLLYKFLLFILNIFKLFLFEKHFFLFNKFINLYGPSSVSTEFRKILFSKDNDVHDEYYGDSNFFFKSKNFLNYFKNINYLKLNLLNFTYLLNFRQYNRSLFFFKLKKQGLNFDNSYKNDKNYILFLDVIFEKIKLIYAKKSIFSYIILFIEFLLIFFRVYISNLLNRKKKSFNINHYLFKKKNSKNFKKYSVLRVDIFNQYLNLKYILKKKVSFLFFINIFKNVDFLIYYFNFIFNNIYTSIIRLNVLVFFIFLCCFRFKFYFIFFCSLIKILISLFYSLIFLVNRKLLYFLILYFKFENIRFNFFF